MGTDKLHIAVDLDDVVLDFFQGVIYSMYTEFGVMLLKADVHSWDNNPVKEFPWEDHGYSSWWEWMETHDWLWSTFDAIPGAIGGLHALRAEGHYVECVTSKPAWAEWAVWKWLGRWKPEFHRVTIVGVDEPKWLATDADILIDDRFAAVQAWVESDPTRLAILFDQPWNYNEVLPERVIRAVSWEGVLEAVRIYESLDDDIPPRPDLPVVRTRWGDLRWEGTD